MFCFIFACSDVADSKALLHHASGSINNASSSSAPRPTRKSSQFEVPYEVMLLPSRGSNLFHCSVLVFRPVLS